MRLKKFTKLNLDNLVSDSSEEDVAKEECSGKIVKPQAIKELDVFDWLLTQKTIGVKPICNRYLRRLKLHAEEKIP